MVPCLCYLCNKNFEHISALGTHRFQGPSLTHLQKDIYSISVKWGWNSRQEKPKFVFITEQEAYGVHEESWGEKRHRAYLSKNWRALPRLAVLGIKLTVVGCLEVLNWKLIESLKRKCLQLCKPHLHCSLWVHRASTKRKEAKLFSLRG